MQIKYGFFQCKSVAALNMQIGVHETELISGHTISHLEFAKGLHQANQSSNFDQHESHKQIKGSHFLSVGVILLF
jgi:hypothetical protein